MSKISVNKTQWIVDCLESVAMFLNVDFHRDWEALGRQYRGFKGFDGQQKLLKIQDEIREAVRYQRNSFPPLPLREKFYSVLENASQLEEVARLRKCHGCEVYFVAANTKRRFHDNQCKVDFFNKRPGRKEDMREYMRGRRKAGIKGKKG
jgi:hypothetical protein